MGWESRKGTSRRYYTRSRRADGPRYAWALLFAIACSAFGVLNLLASIGYGLFFLGVSIMFWVIAFWMKKVIKAASKESCSAVLAAVVYRSNPKPDYHTFDFRNRQYAEAFARANGTEVKP